jgi:hypothetical protein
MGRLKWLLWVVVSGCTITSKPTTVSEPRCWAEPAWSGAELVGEAISTNLLLTGSGVGLEPSGVEGTLRTRSLYARDFDGLCDGDWVNLSFDAELVSSVANGDFEAPLSPDSEAATLYLWTIPGAEDEADDARRAEGAGHALALAVDTQNIARTVFDVRPGEVFDLSFDLDTDSMGLSDQLRILLTLYDDLDDVPDGTSIDIWSPDRGRVLDAGLLATYTRYDRSARKHMSIGIQDCETHDGPGEADGSSTYSYFGEWSGTEDSPADLSEPCAGRAPQFARIEFKMVQTCDGEGDCPEDEVNDAVLIDNVSLIRKGQVEVDILTESGADEMTVAQTLVWPAGQEVTVSADVFALQVRLASPVRSSTSALARTSPVLSEVRLGQRQQVDVRLGEPVLLSETDRLGLAGGIAPIEDWFSDEALSNVCLDTDGAEIPCWDLIEALPVAWARMPLYPRVAQVSVDEETSEASLALVYGDSDGTSELDAVDRRCSEARERGKLVDLTVASPDSFWWSQGEDGEYHYDYVRVDEWEDFVEDYVAYVSLVADHYGSGPGAGLVDTLSFGNGPRVAQYVHLLSMLPHETATSTYAQQVDLLNQICHVVEASSFTGNKVYRWVSHDGWMTTDSMVHNLLSRDGVYLDGSEGDVLDLDCIEELSVNTYTNTQYDGAVHMEDVLPELAQVFSTLDDMSESHPELGEVRIEIGEVGYRTMSQEPTESCRTGVGEVQQAKLFGRDMLSLLSLPFTKISVYATFDRFFDPYLANYGVIKPVEGSTDADGYLRYESTAAYRTLGRLASHLGDRPQPFVLETLSADLPSDEIIGVRTFAAEDGYWVGLWWQDRTSFAKRDDAVNRYEAYLDHGMDTQRYIELKLSGLPESIKTATAYRIGDDADGGVEVQLSNSLGGLTLLPPAVGDMPILIHLEP